MIRFENVSKVYKNQTALKSISFTIPANEIVVLIGPSGCGKTTTLKMINRLIKPSSGKIFIKDEDIEKKDVIKLRRNMGYVIQQTGLFPNMTVKENIEIIPTLEGISKEEIVKKTSYLMEMVGLSEEDFLYRYPSQLSGGQNQRIGVARGFALDPEIILMDEPFSALDPLTRAGLQDELLLLQSKFKKTIVFVTHDMDEAVKIADKICIMNEGEIVQFDTPENIMKNPKNEYVREFVGKNRIWSVPELIKARDIMKTELVTSEGDLSVKICVDKMRIFKVDSVIIVDKKNMVQGVITARMVAHVKDRNIQAKEIMRESIFKVKTDDSILNLLQEVQDKDITIIPVVDEVGKLCGIITTTSLVVTLSQQFIDSEEVV